MKTNVVEKIALSMSCTESRVFNPKDIVSDESIIESITNLDDLNMTDRQGRNLLINAVTNERYGIVKYLIDKGFDVNVRDNDAFTPLHAAVLNGNLDILKLLLESGADVNSKNIFGNPPIIVANLRFPIEGFELLIQYGADPALKNEYGVSSLDIFAAYPDILKVLKTA